MSVSPSILTRVLQPHRFESVAQMIKQGIEDPDIGVVVKALTDDNARPEFGYCSLQSINMTALLCWI